MATLTEVVSTVLPHLVRQGTHRFTRAGLLVTWVTHTALTKELLSAEEMFLHQ